MAVNKIVEAAARRLVQKLADLALGPTTRASDGDVSEGHVSHGEVSDGGVASAKAASADGIAAGESAQAAAHDDASSLDATARDAAPREAAHDAALGEAERDVSGLDSAQPTALDVVGHEAHDVSPIRTRTFARLLAAQGHVERALAIYAELIAASPGDLALVQEARAVRAPAAAPATPTIEATRAPAALYGEDQITAAVVDSGTLFVHWEVTDAGAARARLVAESAGRAAGESAPASEPPLTLRIVVLRAGADGLVRSEAIEHAPTPAGGETFVTGLPADATLFAALGVRRGERFVAIAHAPAAYTPPDRPAELPALDFAVPPPPSSVRDATPLIAPVVVRLSATRAAEVIADADALRQPASWSHASDYASAR